MNKKLLKQIRLNSESIVTSLIVGFFAVAIAIGGVFLLLNYNIQYANQDYADCLKKYDVLICKDIQQEYLGAGACGVVLIFASIVLLIWFFILFVEYISDITDSLIEDAENENKK